MFTETEPVQKEREDRIDARKIITAYRNASSE